MQADDAIAEDLAAGSAAGRGEDFALADVIGRADDAVGFHPLDEAGGAVVADLQVALDKAGRSLAFAADKGDGLMIEAVAGAALVVAGERVEGAVIVLGDLVDVVGLGAGF